MEVAILFGLIILNGIFAMSEIALVTSRKARLQKLIDNGDEGAQQALLLGEDPTKFLSTIQIGITSIGVLNGIVGEAALAKPLADYFAELGVGIQASQYLGTGIVVLSITYFSIVLGELVPKRIGQNNPEAVARFVSKPIAILALISKPFVKLLSGSTKIILRIMGIKDKSHADLTEEEIHAVLEEGTSSGVIETNEHAMLKNVFRLDDRQIASLMVPRGDIVYLNIEDDFSDNLKIIESSEHARFPVVRGDLDDILGVVNARKMLLQIAKGNQANLNHEIQEPLYVPETLTGMELLESFKSSDVQMAFVVDEYGEILGIVTLQDLIEAITGEFQTEDPGSSWSIQREDGSWLLDGHIPTPELKDCLSLTSVPDEDKGRYHTLSGLLMLLSGKLPTIADKVEWEDWTFEIVDMDGKTIDKVLAQKNKV